MVAFLLGGIVFGCAVTGVVAPSFAYAQSASNIVVEGNRRVEVETIRSYFQPGPGGRLDAVQIDQGLKGLYATGLFQDVRIRQAGGKIIVTVVENAVINRIAFEGNKKVKDEQLMSEVQSQARGTFSRPLVQADTQRLVEIYRRSGRFDVTVTPKIIELPNNRVDLVFEINEGAKTGVAKIRFVGNRTYGDQRLKDVIKTSESNFLSFLKSTDIYDGDRVEADRDLLRRFYLKNGFADVRIVSASAEYEPGQKGFVVTYTIEEGDRYRFGNVEVLSNVRLVDPESIRRSLRVKSGDYYNAEAVEKSVEEASIEIAKRGYPFASVRPRGDRNFETRTINIVFAVEEGARAYIERINIIGNTRTRDYVIRREFDIGEGDAYNRALDRPRRAPPEESQLFQIGEDHERARLGARPHRDQRRLSSNSRPANSRSRAVIRPRTASWAKCRSANATCSDAGNSRARPFNMANMRKGFELGFVEPYLLGQRIALGLDLFGKERTANSYQSYDTQHDRRRGAARLPAARGRQPAAALFALSAGNHAARHPERLYLRSVPDHGRLDLRHQRRSLDSGSRRAVPGRGGHLDGRLYAAVQHPRQQQSADPRHDRGLQTRRRGRRRRHEFHPLHGRCALLFRMDPGHHQRHPSARPAISTAGATKTSACWITSRWVRTWCADLPPPASGRAISRRDIPAMRSAARCIGARASNSRSRSISFRRMSA